MGLVFESFLKPIGRANSTRGRRCKKKHGSQIALLVVAPASHELSGNILASDALWQGEPVKVFD